MRFPTDEHIKFLDRHRDNMNGCRDDAEKIARIIKPGEVLVDPKKARDRFMAVALALFHKRLLEARKLGDELFQAKLNVESV